MLTITKAQMEALKAADFRRFESELITRLRENFAPVIEKHDLDDASLRQIIRQGLVRSETYQIYSEYDVTRFIEYVFEYGNQFESLPWAAPILTASHLSGEEKMDRLDAVSAFSLRQNEESYR